MDLESRTILAKDLVALRDCGRNRLDTLSLYPSTEMRILQVMAARGTLELVYPSEGLFDVRISRFVLFGLKRKRRPRFEWWGNRIIAVRLKLGTDVDTVVEAVDSCFTFVFGVEGPFRLEFQRMGWRPAQATIHAG